jgi:hypothetical protein
MSIVSDFLDSYSPADYRREKRLLDQYEAWAAQFTRPNGWTVIPAKARPKGKAALVDNAMRSRVQRFEIFTQSPDCLTAYIGDGRLDGMGIDRICGQSFPVTVWTGEPIGYATRGRQWRVNSAYGSNMAQFYAVINGREYSGRSFGAGSYINLKETAASKRKAAANA